MLILLLWQSLQFEGYKECQIAFLFPVLLRVIEQLSELWGCDGGRKEPQFLLAHILCELSRTLNRLSFFLRPGEFCRSLERHRCETKLYVDDIFLLFLLLAAVLLFRYLLPLWILKSCRDEWLALVALNRLTRPVALAKMLLQIPRFVNIYRDLILLCVRFVR